MTLLTAPEVSVRTVVPLDFRNRAHRGLLFDLANVNARHLLNDVDNDILMIIAGYEERQKIGELHAFIAAVDDMPAGCFWIEIDRYGIGRVRGALFPEFRTGWNAIHFLRWIVDYGFGLGIRKLESEMTMYQKKDTESANAERLLKRIGFKFRAALPAALMINGQPQKTILLDYLKEDYDVKRKQ